jgi:hypothetical protein
MKTLFKLGLLASTLLTVATSAFAISGQQIVGLSTTNIQTVPEPSALGLLGLAIVVLALVRRKK